MSEGIKLQMISRRRTCLLGLAAALAFATPTTVLTVADAEAATDGTERRQERRTNRTERRQERRTARTDRRKKRHAGRTERRKIRRTATTGTKGTTDTTGKAPAQQPVQAPAQQ